MNVNKKFDRFRQWAGEKMGAEAKTNTSDDFKALEMEMNLRHDGMDKLHKSMNLYVKALSKKNEGEDRDKMLPVGYLGSTMVSHGQDFQHDSQFGNCLISLGRANEALARRQESYVVSATSTWLESLERSLAQMKEYQAARKKLEARRIAYDASLAKMQKAKREDFRIEEELRAQKAKYEESSEDVYRRMEDIKEAELESVTDLSQFLEAELAYYDSCRDILMQLKRNWPASLPGSHSHYDDSPARRSRANTAHSFTDRFSQRACSPEEDPEPMQPKVTIPRLGSMRSSYNPRSTPANGGISPPRDFAPPPREYSSYTTPRDRSPTNVSSSGMPRISRMTTEPSAGAGLLARTAGLRGPARTQDDYYDDGRSDSPTSGSTPSRTTSWSTADTMPPAAQTVNSAIAKKGPPPPPPSRATKPKPPVPPAKRVSVIGGAVGGLR